MDDALIRSNLEADISILGKCIQITRDDPKLINFNNLILNNWIYLNNCTQTYRLMVSMCQMKKDWKDTPKNRLELVRILKEISSEWKE